MRESGHRERIDNALQRLTRTRRCDNVTARLRERLRDRRADAAARAGDHRDACAHPASTFECSE
jgi:hypothetical protein